MIVPPVDCSQDIRNIIIYSDHLKCIFNDVQILSVNSSRFTRTNAS